MPKVKLGKQMWALGLVLTLLSFNLAYVKATVNEGPSAPATKERTYKLKEDGSTKTPNSNLTTTTGPSEKKKVSNRKTLKDAVKSCACSCPTTSSRASAAAAAGPWWNCTYDCLRSWGVSPVQLALCAGVCALGAIPICALCVGVSVAVMQLCAIGCATYAGFFDLPNDPDHVPILVRKTHNNNRRKAERRTMAFAVRK